MLAGSPWDSCTIQNKKLWVGVKKHKHQQFSIICRGLPVYGAFLSEHGQKDRKILVPRSNS